MPQLTRAGVNLNAPAVQGRRIRSRLFFVSQLHPSLHSLFHVQSSRVTHRRAFVHRATRAKIES